MNWIILGVLILVFVVVFSIWLKFRPKLQRLLAKNRKLDAVVRQHNLLCKSRADFVYHYFWAIDSGELKAAASHEARVLQADTDLEKLRLEFETIKAE